jgi:DDE superfamily endonuclease
LRELIQTTRNANGQGSVRVPVESRLSMALRYLAGGSYLDIAITHHVSISTFYYVVDETLTDLDQSLNITFPIDNLEQLKRSSFGFSRGHSPLTGCAGALDGIAIKIFEPCAADAPNPATDYNRKGFFALCIQAVCDFDYTFTFISSQCPGSTHDSVAFAVSGLAKLLHCGNSGLPSGYWIAADDAYCCRGRLMTPWPGRRLSMERDCFNYWQSSARIHIEQAFGMLVGRWGIFWRPIRGSVQKASRVVVVCMKLHNFIISQGSIAVPDVYEEDNEQHRDAPDRAVHFQDGVDTDDVMHRRRRDLESSFLRDILTQELKDRGLRRPNVYSCAS